MLPEGKKRLELGKGQFLAVSSKSDNFRLTVGEKRNGKTTAVTVDISANNKNLPTFLPHVLTDLLRSM